MDAQETNPDDEWPLPPAWMWDCRECVARYKAMKQAPEIVDAARERYGPGLDCDPMDSVLSTQIRLAQHIAVQHAADLPEFDPACERCGYYAKSRSAPASLGLEHRAFHLFRPPSIVGLL